MEKSEFTLFLERTAQAHERLRSQMRAKRAKHAEHERRYDELQAMRENAPWRHYLREWRLDKELSLQDLSKATGISKEMISRYETHKRGLSLDTLYRLIAAIGIQPSQAFHSPKK